jgi:hypothetical protein
VLTWLQRLAPVELMLCAVLTHCLTM